MKILSFGGGVQTVTMAVMACKGDLPIPDAAIFADTQWEPKAVYEYIATFEGYMARHGLKLIKGTAGNLREEAVSKKKTDYARMPLFTLDEFGNKGMLPRQCTDNYKIKVVRREIRKLLGGKVKPVECWLGISVDEASRMKPSHVRYITNTYPLIDKGFNRNDCIAYLKRNDIPVPPKSACIGCPFHSDYFWLNLKRNSPDEWRDAVEFDYAIRRRVRNLKATTTTYLHGSCRPLDKVDLLEGQGEFGFINECEGHCGL